MSFDPVQRLFVYEMCDLNVCVFSTDQISGRRSRLESWRCDSWESRFPVWLLVSLGGEQSQETLGVPRKTAMVSQEAFGDGAQ